MTINFQEAEKIVEKSVDCEVQYREDGIHYFTDDIVKSFSIDDKSNVIIGMKNNVIINNEVKMISITRYDERVDMWIYGKVTNNRFNIYKK